MITGRGNGSLTTRSGPTPACCATPLEPPQVVHRALVVLVGRIVFDGQDHRVRSHEPRDVVDVAVRVVADAAFAEPDRVADAEPLREDLLVVLRVESRVADLDVAEQPLLGDEQQPVAVDLDAAAFEHDPLAGVRRAAARRAAGR